MVKKLIKAAIFFILLSGLLFIFAEVSLRIASLFPEGSKFFINDKLTGYRMRPHTAFGGILTNAYGFNDIEHSLEKPKGVLRIAFIGDSITFGLPRKDNFVFFVEQKAKANGIKLEALNMGMPGADPGTYLKLLKNDALGMKCDAVAIMFFIGNDIIQSHQDFETKIQLGQPKMLLKQAWKIGFSSEYWYIYRFGRIGSRLMAEIFKNKNIDGTFTRKNFLDIEKHRLAIYRISPPSFIRDSYAATLKVLKALSLEAKANKMKFFVVLIPDEVQVDDALKEDLFKTYRLNACYYDFKLPQHTIKNYLNEQGVLCLDLLPSFKDQSKKAPLYIKQDTHWNRMGHDLAAVQIWNFIKGNNLM